jgi:hypothetical protein
MKAGSVKRIWVVSALVGVLALTLMIMVAPGSQYRVLQPLESTSATDGNILGLSIQLQQVSTKESQARLLVAPSASGQVGQGLPNGAFFATRVILNLDVAEGTSFVDVPPGTIAGGEFVAINLSGSEENYPFDSYSASFFAASSTPNLQGAESPRFVISDPGVALPGFQVTSQQIGFLRGDTSQEVIELDRQAGYGLITWKLERSASTILSALVVALLMIIGAFVSVALTVVIFRKSRPPSIGILVWLAAFLFALFQVRRQLPGDPSSGIILDRFVFFPIVLVMVSLVAVNVVLWASREDWDMVNPLSAIGGRLGAPTGAPTFDPEEAPLDESPEDAENDSS